MKCKNCGQELNFDTHPNWDCKQFIPSEVLKPTNECQISNHSPHKSKRTAGVPVSTIGHEDKDPDSLKCLDEKGTNTSSGSAFILSDKIDGLIDEFIEEWCGSMSAHLLDSDENDGERLRDNIKELYAEFIRLLKEELQEQLCLDCATFVDDRLNKLAGKELI